MINKCKSIWANLSSRSKKIIKTFVEAGLASALTFISSDVLGLNKDSVKVLVISSISAGISAVLNIKNEE